MSDITTYRSNLANLHKKAEKLKAEVASEAAKASQAHSGALAILESDYAQHLSNHRKSIADFAAALPPLLQDSWDEEVWRAWTPEKIAPPGLLIGGTESMNADSEIRLPMVLPFVGRNQTLIFKGDKRSSAEAIELFQSLIVRAALSLPHQCRFTFLDAATQGRAFPLQRALPEDYVRLSSHDFFQDLDAIRRDITRINSTYLDMQVTSFEMLPSEVRLNEKFELIFIANYPEGFDRRSLELIQNIGNNGPRAGKYLFIHWDESVEGPRDLKLDNFQNVLYPGPRKGFKHSWSLPPSQDVSHDLLTRLAASKPPERKTSFEDIVGMDPDGFWQESAEELVSAPVGTSGASKQLKIWFGANDEGKPCSHGVLGAMTGAGKSNLYHVLIMGLALRYSPEELRLYLIDGKFGVEFESYRTLPHAEVVSLHTRPDLSRSVLVDLTMEMERRNTLFARAKVNGLASYRRAGQPFGTLPRIVLLVDEYQELFEGDTEGAASRDILQLAQQGRSAGIHMLLGAQSFSVVGMMNQNAVMGNMHMRVAMKLPLDAVNALTEFGRRGRELIAQCDMPGKVVINDSGGADGGDVFGKVAYIDPVVKERLVTLLAERAEAQLAPHQRGRNLISDGEEQPRFTENPSVLRDLHRTRRLGPDERESLARKPLHEGGLGSEDWYAGERPFCLWLGQEFNIHGHGSAVLRRRSAENLVMLGDASAARFGMMAAMILSLGLGGGPSDVKAHIVDGAAPGTPWQDLLGGAAATLNYLGIEAAYSRGSERLEATLAELTEELERRKTFSEFDVASMPSLFLFLADMDRIRLLERVNGRYGLEDSPAGQKLVGLVVEGPSLGIHVVAGFSGFMPMTRVMDARRLDDFRHRVALKISEDESFTIVRSRKASQLQPSGKIPIDAIYFDLIGGRSSHFKPYVVDDKSRWSDQFSEIKEMIGHWSRTP